MQREFGKRTAVQAQRQTTAQLAPASGQPARDPFPIGRAMLAIGLTVTIVGGMFLIPKLAQCDGRRSFLGLDWCRLVKATVEGASRSVASGRGAISSGR